MRQKYNPWRWVEYAFTATLMTLTMSGASRTTDVDKLLCVCALSVAVMVMGGVAEKLHQTEKGDQTTKWCLVATAVLCFVVYWLPLILDVRAFWNNTCKNNGKYLKQFGQLFRDNDAEQQKAIDEFAPCDVDDVLKAVFVVPLTFYVVFPVWFFSMQKYNNTYTQEIGYIVLSFLAKASLAFLLLWASLRSDPSDSVSNGVCRASPPPMDTRTVY